MSRFSLEIRAATPADAAGLAELFAAGGRRLDPGVLGAQVQAIRDQGGLVLLALEWGPPSGVIALGRQPTLERAAAAAVVTSLLVAPEARRRGLARALLKSASQAARQWACERIVIAAAAGEDALQAFCAASGFEPAGAVLARPLRRRA